MVSINSIFLCLFCFQIVNTKRKCWAWNVEPSKCQADQFSPQMQPEYENAMRQEVTINPVERGRGVGGGQKAISIYMIQLRVSLWLGHRKDGGGQEGETQTGYAKYRRIHDYAPR